MRYDPIDPRLFTRNREKLRNKLTKNSLAIVPSAEAMPRTGDTLHRFRQSSDLFYLTGIEQEKSLLVICPDYPKPEHREVLFLLKSDPLLETWEGHKLTKAEATAASGIATVLWLDELPKLMALFMTHSQKVLLPTNEHLRYPALAPDPGRDMALELRRLYPLHDFGRLAPLLASLRVLKEPQEVELIRKACQITRDAFLRVLATTRPGAKEFQVEAEITYEFIRQGASGHAYNPIIASGPSACALHYEHNDKTCRDGDLLLLDFGAEYANHAADCSRAIPVNGKFSPRQRQLYDACLRVLEAAASLLRPGNNIEEYHQQVCRIWEKEHIALGLYTQEQLDAQDPLQPLFAKYYMHGTTHFLGLDVHDVGSRFETFQPGMVFTCEPGIYLAEEGVGIRLENDYLIREEGEPLNLMADIPIAADEIERLMAAAT